MAIPSSHGRLRAGLELEATQGRIGPKSNSEPLWRWSSFKPLFVDASKSIEYRTGNNINAMFALMGGQKFELATKILTA